MDLEETVEAYLLELHERYRLYEVRYDPWQMIRSAQGLEKRGVPMTEYAQTIPGLTEMGQHLYESLKYGNFVLYPDERMRRAAQHTVALESSRGWRMAKEKTSHRIDVIVALAMSALAAVAALAPESRVYVRPKPIDDPAARRVFPADKVNDWIRENPPIDVPGEVGGRRVITIL